MSDSDVKQEMLAREQRLMSIDREIASLEFRLKDLNSNHFVKAGQTALVIAAEAFRRTLREDLQRKKKHRELIIEEVKRARERLEFDDEH